MLAAPRPVPPASGWEAVDWGRVVRLAIDQLLAPAVWAAVARDGISAAIPAALAEPLRVAYRRNRVRNVALRAQLAAAVGALNSAGIVPLLFKGSLYLIDGTFRDPGERFQWDLDLAVAPGEVRAATLALRAQGYRPERAKPFLHPHELSLVREAGGAPLELHTRLGSPPIPQALPVRAVARAARSIEVGEAQATALSATHAAIHNVLHAQVQDLNHSVAGIAVRQLHTLARLSGAHAGAIDWDAVRWALRVPPFPRILDAYLYQAEVLLGAPLAHDLLSRGRARLHHLRCLVFWELGWPADVLRNLRYAFGPEYLMATYDRDGRGRRVALLRARHAYQLVHERGRGVLSDITARRV